MARLLLITNPAAARANPEAVRVVSTVLSLEGWEVTVAGTTRPGHATALAAEGVRDGVDVIAVYGGDGTTMQAVQGMMGSEIPLGLIPGGTGNLLAGNLRLPRDPTEAARVLAHGIPRAVDLGHLHQGDEVRPFAVACGAGFDAELMASTTTASKKRWKMGAYVARAWETIGEVRNVHTTVTVDGRVIDGPAASVLVANCAEFVPPFLKFRPGVKIDDGVFDIVILRADDVLQSVEAMLAWLGPGAGGENVQYARGCEVAVVMDPPRAVQLDGDGAGSTPFTARIVPGGLRVLVPRDAA